MITLTLANLIKGIAIVVNLVLELYFWLVIGAVIISWVNADPWNPIVKFLRSSTDPLFRFVRRRMPFLAMGGIDFTPMVIIALIYLLEAVVVGSLLDYAGLLRMRVGY